MKSFAEKMKELRKERGMLQEEFGNLLGVSRRMIIDYESGERKPFRKKLMHFAEILEVPPEYLLDDRFNSVLEVFSRPSQDVLDSAEKQRRETETQAVCEMEFLKERSVALFAGGDLPDEYKEAFFQSMYQAYLKSKIRKDTEE